MKSKCDGAAGHGLAGGSPRIHPRGAADAFARSDYDCGTICPQRLQPRKVSSAVPASNNLCRRVVAGNMRTVVGRSADGGVDGRARYGSVGATARRACDATPPASCNSAKHRSYAGRQMRAGLFAAKLVLEAASPYSARNMTLHRICAARSALSGALVGVVLLAGCSTGRVPARESEAPHAHRPAAGSPPVATPDFDASAMRVRALLEQLVAADTRRCPPAGCRDSLPAIRIRSGPAEPDRAHAG